MPLFGGKKTIDEDPDRLIFSWTDHLPLVAWQAKNAYKECHHCSQKFQSGHQHNCRLCGHMFCGKDTGKYHVPAKFKLKKKKDAVRVCFGCRDSCLAAKGAAEKKDQFDNNPLFQTDVAPNLEVTSGINFDEKTRVIYPPEKIQQLAEYSACNKCHKPPAGKPKNCRVCGRLFCDACTIKKVVPDVFLFKGKKGATRVCDSCNYFSEKPGVTFAQEKRVKQPTQAVRKLNARKAAITLPKGALQLTVCWEGKDEVLATVTVNAEDSLMDINQQLVDQQPVLTMFHYLCRSTGVRKTFWDIFKAKHFHPRVYLRAGTVNAPIVQVVGGGARGGPPPIPTTTAPAVPAADNPYSKVNRDKPKEVKEGVDEKEAPPPAPAVEAIQYAFARPAKAAIARVKFVTPPSKVESKTASAAAAQEETKTAAAAPTSSGAGLSVDQQLAQRAKQVFGQLS